MMGFVLIVAIDDDSWDSPDLHQRRQHSYHFGDKCAHHPRLQWQPQLKAFQAEDKGRS
jgi:hypothetical protein